MLGVCLFSSNYNLFTVISGLQAALNGVNKLEKQKEFIERKVDFNTRSFCIATIFLCFPWLERSSVIVRTLSYLLGLCRKLEVWHQMIILLFQFISLTFLFNFCTVIFFVK